MFKSPLDCLGVLCFLVMCLAIILAFSYGIYGIGGWKFLLAWCVAWVLVPLGFRGLNWYIDG